MPSLILLEDEYVWVVALAKAARIYGKIALSAL